MKRRQFLTAAMAAGVLSGQTTPPTRKAKVVKLFKGPCEHPNALEATRDALWMADQVTEKAYKVDWKTGKALHEIQTESHNTSGIAVGGGYVWMSANGSTSNRRPPRPTDSDLDEIVQCDMQTGKTIFRYRPPWPGGSHGISYNEATQTLWVTALGINAIAELDWKDKFRVLREIPVKLPRAHGLDFENGNVWVMFTSDYLIQKLDGKSGKVLEVVTISKEDPDPHGMCFHDGHLYYCDAGFAVNSNVSTDPNSGWVCRIDL